MPGQSVAHQILDWVANHEDGKWIEDGELQICVRFSARLGKLTLEIVNIVAKQKGKGNFTRFLDRVEMSRFIGIIYVENVLKQRFEKFFERRGYKQWPCPPGHVPCYYKELHCEKRKRPA